MITWKSILQFLAGISIVLAVGLVAMKLISDPKPPPGWQTIRPPVDVMALVEYRGDILSGGKSGLIRINRSSGTVQEEIQAGGPFSYVTAIALDGSAGYWVGHGSGLSHFDGTAWRTYTTTEGLPDNEVLTAMQTHSGDVWLGTPRGVARLSKGVWQVYHKMDGLASEAASVIFEDHQGRLWFGDGYTPTGGLSVLDGQSWRTYTIVDGLAHNMVNAILQDEEGNLWFATGFSSQGGVSRFDGTRWVNLHQADGLAGGKARSLFRGPNGLMWIGSEYNGIARFPGDPFITKSQVFTPEQGLAGLEVKAMLLDSAGDLWLGTENGISRIQKGIW